MLKHNEGRVDRGLRITAGLALAVVGFAGVITGGLGLLVGLLGIVLLATGTMGYCPLYTVLGVDTCGGRNATP